MLKDVTKRWSGLTAQYNGFRPNPPARLMDTLLRFAQTAKADLVVDLGCGTGNSTRVWQDKAQHIIGIDPSEEMLSTARACTAAEHIEYRHAVASDTRLPDQCADVVVASAAIHWMEPVSTLKEIKRILKNEGIFSFWGPAYPPVTPFMELDQAFFELASAIDAQKMRFDQTQKFKWSETFNEISRHTHFRFHRYFYLDQEFYWSADDYLNWLNTHGAIIALLQSHINDLLDLHSAFIATVKDAFGSKKHPIFFVYTVHVFK
jgi:ubiquinone/menaquinone biosynthesis C-methylase UbiE